MENKVTISKVRRAIGEVGKFQMSESGGGVNIFLNPGSIFHSVWVKKLQKKYTVYLCNDERETYIRVC